MDADVVIVDCASLAHCPVLIRFAAFVLRGRVLAKLRVLCLNLGYYGLRGLASGF